MKPTPTDKTARSLLPIILALAWPTMLEQLLQTAVQYIDTAMVGSLGTAATAAVGATTTVNWLFGSTVSALGVGFLAYIAQARGAGRDEDARRATGQAVLAVLVCGVAFTVLTLGLSPTSPDGGRWLRRSVPWPPAISSSSTPRCWLASPPSYSARCCAPPAIPRPR